MRPHVARRPAPHNGHHAVRRLGAIEPATHSRNGWLPPPLRHAGRSIERKRGLVRDINEAVAHHVARRVRRSGEPRRQHHCLGLGTRAPPNGYTPLFGGSST